MDKQELNKKCTEEIYHPVQQEVLMLDWMIQKEGKMRQILSDTGWVAQEASWDGESFSLIEKCKGFPPKVIIQNPVEALAFADFIYQQLQVKSGRGVVY